jgi:hypothetical protein
LILNSFGDMLGGWVLDLGDGSGDATHVKFVEVSSGVFFLVFRGQSILRCMCPCNFERGSL